MSLAAIVGMVPTAAEAARHLGKRGRPWVTLAYAQSIDGSIALVRGTPAAFSGPEATRITHRLRAAHQAILVGIGTVLADDPLLTVRHGPGPDPQPVVLDPMLRFPSEARLLRENAKGVWIATSDAAPAGRRAELEGLGAVVLTVPRDEKGRLRLTSVLAALAERGIATVMVEGGATVITSFLSQRLVDRVVVTVVPVFAGGYRSVGELTATTVAALPRLTETSVVVAGADYLLAGRLESRAGWHDREG